MAGLVLIGLIFVLVILIVISKNRKRAIVISLVVIGLYHLYVVNTCGPNSSDVKVMKPMAQKIAEYIVANGIPKSLKDIPYLPYEVEGCKRVEEYRNYSNNKSTKDKAIVYNIQENCKYNNNISIDFGVTLDLKDDIWGGRIELTSLNETVLFYPFKSDKNNIFEFDDMDIGSRKDDGICNPMRH